MVNPTAIGFRFWNSGRIKTKCIPSHQGTKAMTTRHHTSFVITILGSTQRLFRSKRKSLLASHQIDAHTMRDIGINTSLIELAAISKDTFQLDGQLKEGRKPCEAGCVSIPSRFRTASAINCIWEMTPCSLVRQQSSKIGGPGS